MSLNEEAREIIRRKRIELNLTQAELAQLVFNDPNRSRISNIENGRDITTTTLEKLAKKLNFKITFTEI